MSLHYHHTMVTPFEVAALHNLIAQAEEGPDRDTAYRWLCHARSGLYAQWRALPDGDHLKAAYADQVWQWDDQDLAAIPAAQLMTPEQVRELARDLEEGP